MGLWQNLGIDKGGAIMKTILMSIRPQHTCNILNYLKTIEIRKKFPSDYVGWVYICNTKDKDLLCRIDNEWNTIRVIRGAKLKSVFAGKVVARFWCDKVEEIKCIHNSFAIERYITDTLNVGELMVESCVSFQQLKEYLYYSNGYAIHITKLEIFDKPKELWQFKTLKNAERYKHDLEQAYKDDYEIGTRIAEGIANDDECANCVELTELSEGYYGLQKPPQSWCFVEI